ncbi:Cytochrome P450 4C1, partial [Cryptotermes secundus]
MDTFSLLFCGVVLLLGTLFLYSRTSKRERFIRMVDQIPGPRSYPILGTVLPFLFTKRQDLFKVSQKLINENLPLFRGWTGSVADVNLTCPEDVEVILSSSRHVDKSFLYGFLHSWLGTGLLTSTGEKWHAHRKMITPTFHFSILDSFVEVFSEKSEILVSKLQKEVGSQGFDVYPYITKCALDIICETAMGTKIFAQDGGNLDYVTAIYDMSEITVQRIFQPWLHPESIFKLFRIGRRHDECLRVLHGFTRKVIAERKAQMVNKRVMANQMSGSEDEVVGKKRKAFLDLLLEANVGDAKLTDEELREEVDTFMFEGHDTTSAAMCWAIYLLGLHPDVQEKAYEEQESIFQGSDRSPNMKDLTEMKYLERVIKESLRLYPSVPSVARKLNKDVKIAGYDIPSGCTILTQIYFLHRNPDQFPNPEKFDPDNFLPERVAKRHPYAYIPFSAGPRNCIGQKFALLEEKTVLSYILRHYR